MTRSRARSRPACGTAGVPEPAAVLVAVITAIVGPIVAGLVLYLRTRHHEAAAAELGTRRLRTEQEVSVSGVVLSWAQRLEGQVERLQSEFEVCKVAMNGLRDDVAGLKRENAVLREHNRALVVQVLELGAVPALSLS